jgi:hypothetical protein
MSDLVDKLIGKSEKKGDTPASDTGASPPAVVK